jgi:glycosyltransferase involved in cell wall biosynthesis
LCRLDPKKGVNLLIQAFHDVVKAGKGSDWKLVIAGDGEESYVARLKQAAEQGEGRSRITFEGWVNGEERLTLLRDASLFVLPSSQENFGIAVVEALASGVPVIVSPEVNLAPDIEAHEAGWVFPRDRQALAEGLARVMVDRTALTERRRKARQFAGRFRWSTVAEAMQQLYADILHTRAAVHQHLEAVTDADYRAARGPKAGI